MKATFVGHQTWLVETAFAKILIDPLICPDFGLVKKLRLDVYPPRQVDKDAFHDVDLIFLSHEHTDHFDIKSLNLLPRTAKFIVGTTIVKPVKDCIKRLGFNLREIQSVETIDIKDLKITFYPADPQTAFWESRVTQILLEPAEHNDGGIFIAVDALVSDVFREQLQIGVVTPPKLMIVSNNSRISPPGAFQSLENWSKNNLTGIKKTGPLGVQMLSSVVTSFLDDFPGNPPDVAMCGGGFIKRLGDFAAFPFSNQSELSQIANSLSLDVNVVGLLPGQYFDLKKINEQSEVDWIRLDKIQHQFLLEELQEFIDQKKESTVPKSVLLDYSKNDQYQKGICIAEQELSAMAKPLLMSTPGKLAAKLATHNGQKLEHSRIVFIFRCESLNLSQVYALNYLTGTFEKELEHDEKILIKKYPFGMNIPLVDFVAMARGELQIWDIVGVSIKSWFEGKIFDGLVPFFYCYYGENGSPRLLEKVIAQNLKEIEGV